MPLTKAELKLAFEAMDLDQTIFFNKEGEAWLAPIDDLGSGYAGDMQEVVDSADGLSLEDKEDLCKDIQEDSTKTKRYGYKPCEAR